MKKPTHSPYGKKRDEEDKELFISQEVIEKFKKEYHDHKDDINMVMKKYKALKYRNGNIPVVIQYDGADPSRYQKWLEREGLADIDLFFDFSLPINYFLILKRRAKL